MINYVLGYISAAENVSVSLTLTTFTVICNLHESYRIRWNNAKFKAITPFKVIQGHRFCYQSKAHRPYINLPLILHRFQVMADYWSIFASKRGVPHFNAVARVSDISLKTTFFGLHFCCKKCRCIFNHVCVIRPEKYRIQWNYATLRAYAVQGHSR